MFLGGCSFFYGVWKYVEWADKPSHQPYANREFPFDNLKIELGR